MGIKWKHLSHRSGKPKPTDLPSGVFTFAMSFVSFTGVQD